MSRRLPSNLIWLACTLALALSTGCKKASDTAAVHGHINYQGQPLTSASVTFFPEKGRPIAASVSQGEYAIDLPPGNYTLTIEVGSELPPGFKEGDPIPPPKIVLADEYTSRAKSTLKATIQQGQDKPLDFDLK